MSRQATDAEISLAEKHCPELSWSGARINEGGQFHTVLIANDTAVIRMARTADATKQMPRTIRLHELISQQLPYPVPTAYSSMLIENSLSSVAMTFIPGTAHEPHRGDPEILRRLVHDLSQVDLAPIRDHLNQRFAFRGPWTEERIRGCYDALDVELREPATTLWNQLDELSHVEPSLVHGDLAGHNMHWIDGQLAGILDWDLAAAWDPALNTAYLSLWHGQNLIDMIAPDADQAHRARIWLGLMSLESISNTIARTDNPKLGKLLRKVAPRILNAAKAAESRGL